ncbi:MAG: D-alanine--D-alanine ligase family protein [Actinomycetota bacterium]
MNNSGLDRIHVVLLFGGRSAEHDVSCVTAAHVLQALDPRRYVVTAIGIDRSGGWHIAESAMASWERSWMAEQTPSETGSTSDGDFEPLRSLEPVGPTVSPTPVISAAMTAAATTIVFPLLHGPLGEDGTIQGLLEMMGVPYVGSGVLGSAVGMDKVASKAMLAAHGIAQPQYRALRESDISDDVLESVVTDLGLPLFVKPANMGSSVGVSKCRTADEVRTAVQDALRYDEWILIEEAMIGREIEVSVLGNLDPSASVAGEIVPSNEFYDYDDKYVSSGAGLLIPAPLSPEQMERVRELSCDVFRALRADGLARVDFFFEENGRGFLCNEINTMPGFTPISMYPKLWLATGLSYGELIDRLVQLGLERFQRQRRTTDR